MTETKEVSNVMPIKWFSELDRNSIHLVGQKAAYLAEAYNKKAFSKNITIPNGFAITKDTISKFLEKKGIKNAVANILEETNKENPEELKRASTKIKDLIYRTNLDDELTEEIFESYDILGSNDLEIEAGSALNILSNAQEPIFVAVRASANTQRGDSYFNIKGKSGIISAIKKVLASFFSEEVLKEDFENNKNSKDNTTAIIIQRMVQGDKSGILYSENPIEINAIWGLAGGLKLNEIGKDKYLLKRDFRIIEKQIGEKKYAITRDSGGSLKLITLKEGYSFAQVMEEFELQELADTSLRLDDIFKEKLQFEFTIEDDEIAIVKIEPLKERIEDTIEEETEIEEEYEETEIEPIVEEIELTLPEKEETKKTLNPITTITQTKLELLISNEEEAELREQTGLKKGYLTIEEIIKMRGIHPNNYIENFNTKGYGEVIQAGIKNNSRGLEEIWVRLSDFTENEFKGLTGGEINKEDNSLFEIRGIRFLLNKRELLKRELNAISELKTKENTVGVLIPKISSVYELKKVKEILETINTPIKVGIILEIPSSIQLIKDFIEEGIDAVLFSGDTLTEYLLGIDKNNPETKKYYDDTNPALMYQLEYVTRVCRRNNVKTSFIGEATDKKEMIDYLVKKNIESIIVKPKDAQKTIEMIKHAEDEFIQGTDKEIRKYELNKEKERQKKELEEFEKQKEEQIKVEVQSLTQKEEVTPEITIEEAEIVEASTPLEIEEIEVIKDTCEDKDVIEDIDEAVKIIKEEKEEYLKEHKEEEEKEEIKEEPTEEDLDEVEKAIKAIEEEKQEYLKEHKEEEPTEEDSKLLNKPYTGEEEHGPNETPNKNMSDVERAMAEIEAHNKQAQENPRNSNIPKDVEDAMKEIENHNNPKEESEPDEKFNEGLENYKEEIESPNEEELNIIDEAIEEENVEGEVLKEHPEETFDEKPEDVEQIDKEIDSEQVKRDIELIEEERREYLKEQSNENQETEEKDFADDFSFEDEIEEKEPEFTEQKKDPLGIFG